MTRRCEDCNLFLRAEPDFVEYERCDDFDPHDGGVLTPGEIAIEHRRCSCGTDNTVTA